MTPHNTHVLLFHTHAWAKQSESQLRVSPKQQQKHRSASEHRQSASSLMDQSIAHVPASCSRDNHKWATVRQPNGTVSVSGRIHPLPSPPLSVLWFPGARQPVRPISSLHWLWHQFTPPLLLLSIFRWVQTVAPVCNKCSLFSGTSDGTRVVEKRHHGLPQGIFKGDRASSACEAEDDLKPRTFSRYYLYTLPFLTFKCLSLSSSSSADIHIMSCWWQMN